ncbi:MAG: ribosomal protein S19 family protein [Nanoarchaeota archaeon]|nr:ribosomal protein S19 family protein [Nanoarchaeota archaeon]
MARHRKQEIVKKDFLYRGKTVEYLKTLDVRESAKFLSSSSRRYILNNFDVLEKFIKRCEKKLSQNKRIKTQSREMVIVPKLVGITIGIHNGKEFHDVQILPEMIGHRLGEFSMTRSKVAHGAAGIGSTKGSRALKK